MPYRILYYPSYDPTEVWLRGMLLLADEVIRIIPDDANHRDPDYINRISTMIPNVVSRLSPTILDTQLDSVNLDRLERALYIIERSEDRDKRVININRDGTFTIQGHVSLHLSKLSDDVRRLLDRYQLLDEWESVAPGHIVVPEAVSNLILAYVADRISRRVGYDTVTNHNLGFVVNSLDALGVRDEGDIRGALLAAILKVQIPREIGDLSDDVYIEVRERYAPIRKEFRRVIAALSGNANLREIDDPDQLRARIIEEVSMFREECDKLLSERWMNRFKQYAPLAVGTLISVIAAIFDEKAAAVGFAVAGGLVSVVQSNIQSDLPTPEQRTQRMLADLREEILDRSLITTLALPKPTSG